MPFIKTSLYSFSKNKTTIGTNSNLFFNPWLPIALLTKNLYSFLLSIYSACRRRRRRLKRYPLQVRHKQDWGRGFILLLPQTAALPGSDAGSDVIKPASSFVIQNHQTSCSMWCPMYRTRC